MNFEKMESPYIDNEQTKNDLLKFIKDNFSIKTDNIKEGHIQQILNVFIRDNNESADPKTLKNIIKKQLIKYDYIKEDSVNSSEGEENLSQLDLNNLPESPKEGISLIIDSITNTPQNIENFVSLYGALYTNSIDSIKKYSSDTAMTKLIDKIKDDINNNNNKNIRLAA